MSNLKKVVSHTKSYISNLSYNTKFDMNTFNDMTKIYNQIMVDYEIPKKESILNKINLDNPQPWVNINKSNLIYTDIKKIQIDYIIPLLIKKGLECNVLNVVSEEYKNLEKVIHFMISNRGKLKSTDHHFIFKQYINFIYGFIGSNKTNTNCNLNLTDYVKSVISYITGANNYIYLDIDTIFTKNTSDDFNGLIKVDFPQNILDRIESVGLTYNITPINYLAIERAKKYFYIDDKGNIESKGIRRGI